MNECFVPFRQFVLKVHSRCDLACDHCYVYEHADQSWRRRPIVMSDETIAATAARIGEHASAQRLAEVRVVLHGGEPLLAGPARLGRIAEALRGAVAGICDIDLRIHTNGILLDGVFCELFAAHGVKVGLSIDGDRAANDRHRRYRDGRSSYDKVVRAIGRLREPAYRGLYAGLLCTIDLANDPVTVYDSLVALDPPAVDFLLPHATWDSPPRRPAAAATAYADWLIAVYDRWSVDGRKVGVRLFESVIRTTRGGVSLTEAVGLGPSDLIVVETDGTLEQVDSLKTAYDGAPATGFDVFRHTMDEVAGHEGIAARQRGLDGLCGTCRACPVVGSCGGGLYAHRYRTGTGFANPSVYCADLLKLITHIRQRIRPAAGDGGRRPAHTLPGAELDALAAGFGGGTAIGHLARSQRSLRRALLAAVHDAASARAVGSGAGFDASMLMAGWGVLTQIEHSDRATLDSMLAHPYVRVWSVRCLQRLRTAGNGPGSLTADTGHLASIAAAAAARSGTDARLTVPVRAGAVHLPTFGRLSVGSVATAVVEVCGGHFTVAAGTSRWTVDPAGALSDGPAHGSSSAWQPVRRLTGGAITVTLEDTDPYRDCYQWPAAPRQASDEAARWQDDFEQAWALIRRDHGDYAPGLAAGLTTIMPLARVATARDLSATARHAFGAVGVARPAGGATLALLLIHEFQHVKLGAVLDMFDLYDTADQRLFHAPWRGDPHSLEDLLRGTYAHIAVTGFWRSRRGIAAGRAADIAAVNFAHWRTQAAEAIETLAASGSLTALGERFLAGMQATVATWLEEPVSVKAPATVRHTGQAHGTAWAGTPP